MKKMIISFLLGILATLGLEKWVLRKILNNDGVRDCVITGCKSAMSQAMYGEDVSPRRARNCSPRYYSRVRYDWRERNMEEKND